LRDLIERAVTKSDYFHQPHAAELEINRPHESYYYDLRARAYYPGEFNGALHIIDYNGIRFTNPIHVAQFGIAHLQHYWDTGNQAWLQRAHQIAIEAIDQGDMAESGLLWRYPLEVRGSQGWLSAMAQGQLASFFLRVATLTRDTGIMDAANAALNPFFYCVNAGGVQTRL